MARSHNDLKIVDKLLKSYLSILGVGLFIHKVDNKNVIIFSIRQTRIHSSHEKKNKKINEKIASAETFTN